MTEPTLFEMDLPRAVPEMLMRGYEPSGSGAVAVCRACGKPLEWWQTPTGRALPMNPMPTPETPAIAHWSTCTDPNRFRKAKTKP